MVMHVLEMSDMLLQTEFPRKVGTQVPSQQASSSRQVSPSSRQTGIDEDAGCAIERLGSVYKCGWRGPLQRAMVRTFIEDMSFGSISQKLKPNVVRRKKGPR